MNSIAVRLDHPIAILAGADEVKARLEFGDLGFPHVKTVVMDIRLCRPSSTRRPRGGKRHGILRRNLERLLKRLADPDGYLTLGNLQLVLGDRPTALWKPSIRQGICRGIASTDADIMVLVSTINRDGQPSILGKKEIDRLTELFGALLDDPAPAIGFCWA